MGVTCKKRHPHSALVLPKIGKFFVSLQSFDRRRISTCSGYSTGQASIGSPRRIRWPTPVIIFILKNIHISGASYSSEERGEARGEHRESGGTGRSQHWRYSFRRYSEYQKLGRLGEALIIIQVTQTRVKTSEVLWAFIRTICSNSDPLI